MSDYKDKCEHCGKSEKQSMDTGYTCAISDVIHSISDFLWKDDLIMAKEIIDNKIIKARWRP